MTGLHNLPVYQPTHNFVRFPGFVQTLLTARAPFDQADEHLAASCTQVVCNAVCRLYTVLTACMVGCNAYIQLVFSGRGGQ